MSETNMHETSCCIIAIDVLCHDLTVLVYQCTCLCILAINFRKKKEAI